VGGGAAAVEARLIGPDDLPERFGVTEARQVVDVLALMGDSSDNVPGVPGVGPKTAGKLIAQHGSLEGLFAHLHTLAPGLRAKLIDAAREQAIKGVAGSMEGHAEMDMSAGGEGGWWQRLRTPRGFTATADYFVMDWAAIWRDIAVGLLVAGALAAWVPESWWQSLFLVDHPTAAKVWGPVIGPLVAVISFVCSVGNIPLAAVLWNGGISFGGVIAFIFGDLIIAPILNIYRKYYGTRMMFVLLGTFYATMVIAGYLVELLFGAAGLIPTHRNAMVMQAGISWNYTTWLNIAFLVVAAVLVIRFIRTGGIPMLAMMGGAPDAEHTPACHEPAKGHRVEDQGHHRDQRGSEHDQTVEQAHNHHDHR